VVVVIIIILIQQVLKGQVKWKVFMVVVFVVL